MNFTNFISWNTKIILRNTNAIHSTFGGRTNITVHYYLRLLIPVTDTKPWFIPRTVFFFYRTTIVVFVASDLPRPIVWVASTCRGRRSTTDAHPKPVPSPPRTCPRHHWCSVRISSVFSLPSDFASATASQQQHLNLKNIISNHDTLDLQISYVEFCFRNPIYR